MSESPIAVEDNDRIKTISYDQIPDVMDNLYARLNKTSKGVLNGKLPLENAILDLEGIKEVVNEGQNTNYAFALDMPDRPSHIYNLIVTKRPDGTIEEPMVIDYKMEPEDMEAFFKSGEDYSLFKSEYKYYRFDNIFNDSKGFSVGKEDDCGGGSTGGGSGGGSSITPPGGTFTHTFDGHTVTNIFSPDAVGASYGYSISIRTQNDTQVSTVATSGTVQISTPGPTGTLISHNVAPSTSTIGVTNNTGGSASAAGSCFTITEIGDGVVLITAHPCGGNAPQQKGPASAREGDCGSPDGSFAINTAAKAVAKLDYHLPGGLTGGQLAWFSDSDHPDRKYIAQDMVWFMLDRNKSAESVSFVLLAIDALLQGGEVDFEDKIINNLTGKAKCVYDKLLSLSTSFKDAIQEFDGDFPVAHLTFDINDLLSNGNYGVTYPPANYNIKIELSNVQLAKITNVGASIAIAHEVIHAEIYRKMLSAAKLGDLDPQNMTPQQQVDYVNSLRNNFFGIYDYYISRYRPTWNHNMMATHYKTVLADIAEKFDNYSLSRQVYEDIAWAGLRKLEDGSESVAWSELSNSEQSRILSNLNQYFYPNENCQ